MKVNRVIGIGKSVRWSLIMLLCLFYSISPVVSQKVDSVSLYYQKALKVQRASTTVLGAWGIANMVGGGLGWANATGDARYFHQMNFAWGVINTGIAVVARVGIQRQLEKSTSPARGLSSLHTAEKLLLLNTGLDVAYLAAGWAFTEKANQPKGTSEKWKGYGHSLLLQGSFLLLFDAVQYGLIRKHSKKMEDRLLGLSVVPAATGVGIAVQF